jgi:GT2 family glycosyltransferase
MAVTVVIVNWNSGALLERTLAALARQTLQPDEVLVFDNKSDVPPLAICQAAGVRLIASEQNIGFAAANNRAIDQCTTEFVALLNPDAFPEPDWLQSLVGAAREHAAYAAFGSRQLTVADPDILDGTGDVYHLSGLAWRNRYGAQQGPVDLVSRETFSPCAAAALYRREALVAVGGFDEDFFCYFEDVDLGFRLRLAGYRCLYVPQAVVHHVGSATTGGGQSDFSVYYGHRNLTWAFVQNMPGALFWLLAPLHLAAALLEIGVYLLRGRAPTILRAKRDAIAALPRVWKKRKAIQVNRVATIAEIWRALDKWPFSWA